MGWTFGREGEQSGMQMRKNLYKQGPKYTKAEGCMKGLSTRLFGKSLP